MSGNLVCFPRSVIEDIGYPPSEQLPHCRADIVYTLRAKRSGYNLQVLGDATAICPLNSLEEGWASSSITMSKRWQQLSTLKSNIHPPTYWNYCNEVFFRLGSGIFIWTYIKLIAFTIVRLVIPLAWLQQLKTYKDALLHPSKSLGNS